jgi:Tol biopolymer transport system component
VLIGEVDTADPAALRNLGDRLRQKGAAAVFLGCRDDRKVTLLAMVTLDRGAYRIGTLDLKSGSVRVLTEGRLDESPSFAPNGAVLIYGAQDRGRGVLATVSVDGSVQQRLAAEHGDIREPVWAPFPTQ